MAVVVASSPGKVLLTGGYLILERPNAGIVLSTNARFYAIIKPIHRDLNPDSLLWSWADVKLTSPQLSRQNEYKMSLKNSALQCISPRDLANPFMEQAVQYVVAAAHTILVENSHKDLLHKRILHGLDITILGSNDFYSYRNQTFVDADSNGDWKIDPNEWNDFVAKNPSLIKNTTLPYLKKLAWKAFEGPNSYELRIPNRSWNSIEGHTKCCF